MSNDSNPEGLAKKVVAAMYACDLASRSLGMRIEAVASGCVKVSMPVRADMIQAVGTCHGGFIFTLADSAFAFACNSTNEKTVAAGCQIEYLLAVGEGDVLVADAIRQLHVGRNGIYDVTVRNQRDEIVAVFRGKSRRISGETIAEL